MFMSAEVWDLNQGKNVKIYDFVRRNLFAYTEN